MTIPNEHLLAYISEIDVILKTCTNEAKVYAKYRSIGASFNENAHWLKNTRPQSISFFNGLTAMLELSVVMAVWKMMEIPNKKFLTPGEIEPINGNRKRKQHDEIRSLPRLIWLFRATFEESSDNFITRCSDYHRKISEKIDLPEKKFAESLEAIERKRKQLLAICSKIDALLDSDAHSKLDIIRNEGFAHSSAISRKFIQSDMNEDNFDFARTALYRFGDEVMQLALDFDSIWHRRGQASINDLIKKGIAAGSDFWSDMKNGLAPNLPG